MKTLLACAFCVSFLATAVIFATASEPARAPAATVYAGPASIVLPISVLSQAPSTVDLKPSLVPDEMPVRLPVRVVLASPYVR